MKEIIIKTGYTDYIRLAVELTEENQAGLCELACLLIFAKDYITNPEREAHFRDMTIEWLEMIIDRINDNLKESGYFDRGRE